MKKIRIILTMTEQESHWLEQVCFIEDDDLPHSKFLNRVSKVARRARHAFQQSVQRTCDHERTLRMPSGKLLCCVCQEYVA